MALSDLLRKDPPALIRVRRAVSTLVRENDPSRAPSAAVVTLVRGNDPSGGRIESPYASGMSRPRERIGELDLGDAGVAFQAASPTGRHKSVRAVGTSGADIGLGYLEH